MCIRLPIYEFAFVVIILFICASFSCINALIRLHIHAPGPGYCSFAITSASQDGGVSEKDLPADLGEPGKAGARLCV